MPWRRALLLTILLWGAPPAVAQSGGLCGNGTVDGNEQCDGGPCCTATCFLVPTGTICGQPTGPCDFPDICIGDGICVTDQPRPDGTRCDDGDECTTGDICSSGQCVGAGQVCTVDAQAPRPLRGLEAGKVVLVVTCSVPGGAGGTCSATAFLPPPSAATAVVAGGTTPVNPACDISRQVTRTAKRRLDEGGTARLKLRLNKLARRLIRALPVSDALTLNVCTTIALPSGDTITLVDVVNVARKKARR